MISQIPPSPILAKRKVDKSPMGLRLGILGCLLLMLLVSGVPAEAAVFPAREPYIQLVTPNSVTVVWRTDDTSADDSQVHYGTMQTPLTQVASAIATTRVTSGEPTVKDHIVTINGLLPGTKYFYDVGTVTNGIQGGGTANHFFVTAPEVGSTTPFKVWVVGDSGNGTLEQTQVRDTMLTETALNPPDLMLHAGDIAYESGLSAEFTNFHFKIYENILINTPSWPTLGNHEDVSANSLDGTGPYFDSHVLPTNAEAGGFASGTEAYYSFDYANTHFIVLNSEEIDSGFVTNMVAWLNQDLATTQDWVIALWHSPPYSNGTHNSDSSEDSGGRMVNMRETVLPILEAAGVDLVLSGHSHAYERSYLIDGAWGYASPPNDCNPTNDPNFTSCTPSFTTLQADSHIKDASDGDPATLGDGGAYQKTPGAPDGTVYVVAGHGGKSIGGAGGHPVMVRFDPEFGSVLVDINGATLTGKNLNRNGVITDTFVIQKTGGTATELIVNGIPDPLTAGSPATVTVTAVDEQGLIDPNYTGTVTFSGGGADAALPGNYSFTTGLTGDNGVHTFVNDVTLTALGDQTVTVTDTVADTITGSQSAITVQAPPAPVIITDLTPASYGMVAAPPGLQVGDRAYIDRTYTFTTIPALVQGEAYIRTANNDKNATANPFLTFTVNQPVTVYVAHDKRILLKPSWFATLGFTDSGENLVTTDAAFDLFAASFSAGTIQLGGNEGGGSGSMYSVIVKSQGAP